MSDDGRYIFVVSMDIPDHLEEAFNDIYDNEHMGYMLEIPGVSGATRLQAVDENLRPRYMALYDIDSPAVIETAEFRRGGDRGRWASVIRPHTYNRHLGVYRVRG